MWTVCLQVPTKVRTGTGSLELELDRLVNLLTHMLMLSHLSKPSTLGLLLHVSELTQGKARILIHRNWMRAAGELSLCLPEFCWAPQNLRWVENSVFVEESIGKTCLVLHVKYAFRRFYGSFSSWGPNNLGEILPPRGDNFYRQQTLCLWAFF